MKRPFLRNFLILLLLFNQAFPAAFAQQESPLRKYAEQIYNDAVPEWIDAWNLEKEAAAQEIGMDQGQFAAKEKQLQELKEQFIVVIIKDILQLAQASQGNAQQIEADMTALKLRYAKAVPPACSRLFLPTQQKRLTQIVYWLASPKMVISEAMIKRLALTLDQARSITQIVLEYRAQTKIPRDPTEYDPLNPIQRAQVKKEDTAAWVQINNRINALLTAKQRMILTELRGKLYIKQSL